MRVAYFEDIKGFVTFLPYSSTKESKKWSRILKNLDSGLESQYKLAVTEAEEMLGEKLSSMGYQADTFEQILEKAGPSVLSNIEALKEAHQARNNVLRNPDFSLSLEETKKVLDIYEKALRDIQAL